MALKKDLFRKESLDNIKSPEKLDEYIRVSNPSVWVILAAILIIIAGVGIWSVFGTVPIVYNTAGITFNNITYAYIDVNDVDALPFKIGQPVILTQGVNSEPYHTTITKISKYPKSKKQVSEGLDDYEIYALEIADWVYVFEMPVEDYDDHDFAYVQIHIDEIRPYTFLIG